MRLGEIKNKISRVLDENKHIKMDHETVYGGQAYKIKNYPEILDVLKLLSKEPWNDADYSQVEEIVAARKSPASSMVVSSDEFNLLNSYISSVNSKIPLFYSFLESVVEKQDEKTINIKLPSAIESLEGLDAINKRLEATLKLFNIDGSFKFQGFDKGSDWYILVAGGILTHQYLISCIKVAQEYLKAKTEYFKSKEAQLSYEAASAAKGDKKISLDQYQDKWLALLVENGVKEIIQAIKETNGRTEEELQTRLVKATAQLVKELGEGTEFHLSLNPPKYAKEKAGQLVIDYQKIEELRPSKPKDTKGLKAPDGDKLEPKKKEPPAQK